MDFVAKITLVAAAILLGYNLYQLMTGYEAVCDKVEEFKRLAKESESDEIAVKRSNFVLTGLMSLTFVSLVFFSNFAYWVIGFVAAKMICTVILSHMEIVQIFSLSKIDRKFFMWTKVDAASNVAVGLAVAVVLVS